jgi:EmrB/QacA subfamily drug resistance transporter
MSEAESSRPRAGRRLIPLIVACSLFMENLDSTIIATALPSIARSLGENPVRLSLAITCYLFSLAVFIPISGWVADRFGARNVLRTGIAIFTIGSIACGLSESLTGFVVARTLQGMGGAMMTPVGRLVLLRSVPKPELVNAMAWVTMPALIGPMLGPPIGGFITTYADWRWIFWINVPIGLLGILLVSRFIPNTRETRPPPFDGWGFVLCAVGLLGLVIGFEALGRAELTTPVILSSLAIGCVGLSAYGVHARRVAHPVVDLSLLKIPTFRAGVVGGSLFRIGIGAVPFLLPLMLQLGFGLSAFDSGMLTFAAAAGAMTMKATAAPIIRLLGFKRVLVGNALVSAIFLAATGLFQPTTPHFVIIAVLLVGGFFRSLQFTSINVVAYAEVPEDRMSRATSFASMAQQLSLSIGAGSGALLVHMTVAAEGRALPGPGDFLPAFVAVALISASSALLFARLSAQAGAEMSGHRAITRRR